MSRCYPGPLLRQEVRYLAATTRADTLRRPLYVVMGGAKVADKIGVLWSMIERADVILVGGRMAFTFLAAQGVSVGQTQIEAAWMEVGSIGAEAMQCCTNFVHQAGDAGEALETRSVPKPGV